MNKTTSQLKFEGNNKGKEYKVETICNSAVYAKESDSGHIPGPYYLVSWKSYPEEENTWESASAIQYLRRLFSTFHKEDLQKPTATSPPVNFVLPIAKPIVKPSPESLTASEAKQK